MILKDFYNLKKAAIQEELISTIPNAIFTLYNDNVFTEEHAEPVIMFKYDAIEWETSSEKTYKGDVTFCVSIVMPLKATNMHNYEQVFDIAHKIDKAVLKKSEENVAINSYSIFKAQESQYNYDLDNWEKTKYFIWEITYKTVLVEGDLRKKYQILYNGQTIEQIEGAGYPTLTEGESGNYIKLHPEAEVGGNLYINSITSNNANNIETPPDNDKTSVEDIDIIGDNTDQVKA